MRLWIVTLLRSATTIALIAVGPGCDPSTTNEDAVDDSDGDRGRGKADSSAQSVSGTCFDSDGAGLCGGKGDGSCWCDDACETYGDCCVDFAAACHPEPIELCSPEPLVVRETNLSGDVLWDNCEVHLELARTRVDGTLTIAPGVHVFGDNPATPSSLVVRGSLFAEGTEEQPIVFQPGAGLTQWGGITVGAYADDVTLAYVEMRSPLTGMLVYAGNVSATHVVLDGSNVGTGVSLSPSRPEARVSLDDVLIRGFDTGVSGWRIGGTQGAGSELQITHSVIKDNGRGIFLGTDYDYCGAPVVAKPRGFLRVYDSDLIGNGLAFGVGYDERWTSYRLEQLNIASNADIALIQPYETPAGSSLRDSNLVANEGGVVTFRKLQGRTSFPDNYWGGLDEDDLLGLSSSECGSTPVEERFSFSGVRSEPVESAGPRHPEEWAPVCAEAVDPC